MRRVALGQERFNAQLPQPFPLRLRVIGSIRLHAVWALAWVADFAAHRRNRLNQGLELRHIMSIGAGQDRCQRHALSVGDQVVLAARFGPIRGVRARLVPSFKACTAELSTKA
jgi:hypothetical protein